MYYDFCDRLRLWHKEAYVEKNIHGPTNYEYALYPKRIYKNIKDVSKIYDFCFIGGLYTDEETFENRKWILPFINKHFTSQSYLQFTDKKTKANYIPIDIFDKTLEVEGFVPKENCFQKKDTFDEKYFSNMSRSKFCLCPAGDVIYSMRFYEALMCKTIPIVNTVDETFRSKEEEALQYKYYLSSDEIVWNEEWVNHNYQLFLKWHTLEYFKLI